MDRRFFIKAIGIATTCVLISGGVGQLVYNPKSKTKYLKITNEMIQDKTALREFFVRYAKETSGNDPRWESKTKIKLGLDGDDFVRNIMTCVLIYTP